MQTFNIKNLLFLSVFLLILPFSSCKTTKSVAQVDQPLENALLWELTGPGISQPSYVFGTIHLIDSKDYFLPKGTMTALDKSNKIVFEIDMKEMSDMSAMMGIMGKIFMKDNTTLKDLLSSEDYDYVSDYFQKKGMPIMMIERMKPMFLTALTYGDFEPGGLGNSKMKSYEMELLQIAEDSGKETGGLETIDFQLSLFDEIPYDAQAMMLVESIKSSEDPESSSQLNEMTSMYLNQNINAMVQMIGEEDNNVEGFEEKLLTKRNESWIPLMITGAKKGPVFYAVGAGHLAGSKGVINLLRKQGYTVKPLSHK
ncbi:MAG: TraB/GumN family protein [Chitinophagales bacterium]|nr:TraB/GumN family protein [Chitinophagales bacterium]